MIKKLLLNNWRLLTLCIGAFGISTGELVLMIINGSIYEPDIFILATEAIIFIGLIILSITETIRIVKNA